MSADETVKPETVKTAVEKRLDYYKRQIATIDDVTDSIKSQLKSLNEELREKEHRKEEAESRMKELSFILGVYEAEMRGREAIKVEPTVALIDNPDVRYDPPTSKTPPQEMKLSTTRDWGGNDG